MEPPALEALVTRLREHGIETTITEAIGGGYAAVVHSGVGSESDGAYAEGRAWGTTEEEALRNAFRWLYYFSRVTLSTKIL